MENGKGRAKGQITSTTLFACVKATAKRLAFELGESPDSDLIVAEAYRHVESTLDSESETDILNLVNLGKDFLKPKKDAVKGRKLESSTLLAAEYILRNSNNGADLESFVNRTMQDKRRSTILNQARSLAKVMSPTDLQTRVDEIRLKIAKVPE